MTPEAMAALHQRCLTVPRPYTVREFAGFSAAPDCIIVGDDLGFAVGRVAADEAELLTIVIDPGQQRQGRARVLMQEFEARARQSGVSCAFLEVAEQNAAARGLYHSMGYTESGRRRGYYRHPDGHREDAIVMQKPL